VARVQQIVAAQPAPGSLARTSYRALHAYRFVNADGHGRWARYHWEPAAGVEGQAAANMAALPHNLLFDELDDRLTREPAAFALELQLAADDDPAHDVSAFWPENRERVTVGRLELVRPISLEEIGDSVMMHDPTRVTDGIETHPDEIMNIRRGAYLVSAAERTGGWQHASSTLSTICPGSAISPPEPASAGT
jgi:catalase